MENYGNVLYYPKDISNILSISNVSKKNLTIYNSKNGEMFIVINTRPGGLNMMFTARNDGIYYDDMRNTEGMSMLNILEDNQKQYTQQKHEREKIAI